MLNTRLPLLCPCFVCWSGWQVWTCVALVFSTRRCSTAAAKARRGMLRTTWTVLAAFWTSMMGAWRSTRMDPDVSWLQFLWKIKTHTSQLWDGEFRRHSGTEVAPSLGVNTTREMIVVLFRPIQIQRTEVVGEILRIRESSYVCKSQLCLTIFVRYVCLLSVTGTIFLEDAIWVGIELVAPILTTRATIRVRPSFLALLTWEELYMSHPTAVFAINCMLIPTNSPMA